MNSPKLQVLAEYFSAICLSYQSTHIWHVTLPQPLLCKQTIPNIRGGRGASECVAEDQ